MRMAYSWLVSRLNHAGTTGAAKCSCVMLINIRCSGGGCAGEESQGHLKPPGRVIFINSLMKN